VVALNLCFEGFAVLAAPMNYMYNGNFGVLTDYVEMQGGANPNLIDIYVDGWSEQDPFIFNSNRDMADDGTGTLFERAVLAQNADHADIESDGDPVHRRLLPGDRVRGRDATVVNNSDRAVTLTLQMFYRMNGVETYNPFDALINFGGGQVPDVTDDEFYFDNFDNDNEDNRGNPDGWQTRGNLENASPRSGEGRDYGVDTPAEGRTRRVDPAAYNEFCDLLKEKARMRIFVVNPADPMAEIRQVYYGPAFPEGSAGWNASDGTDLDDDADLSEWRMPENGALYNGQISLGDIPPGEPVRFGFEIELPGRELDGHGYSGDLDALVSLNSEQFGRDLNDLYGEYINDVNFLENEYMLNETTFWLKFGAGLTPTASPSPSPSPFPSPSPIPAPPGAGEPQPVTPTPTPIVLPTDDIPYQNPSPTPIVVTPEIPPFPNASPRPSQPTIIVIAVPGADTPKSIPKTGDMSSDMLRNVIIISAMLLIALLAFWRKKKSTEEEEEEEDGLILSKTTSNVGQED
jgi:LPXTG-motif cell wall-anchored protein